MHRFPLRHGFERISMDSTSRASTSMKKDQVDQLESSMAEIGKVKEENKILKMKISKIMEDYQSLYVYLKNFVRQKEAKVSEDTAPTNQEIEETEISLSLGRISGEPKKEEKSISSSKCEGSSKSCWKEPMTKPSPETSFEEQKEEEAGQKWSANKILGTKRSSEDDGAAQQIQVNKARVSVRTRCDTPTMNDGCQWRKYGQKISKGNPCPRAYYRCIVAPTCPVRKRVQRCAEDMSLLITTYEGNHNHFLPVSATAMASTTSAAASMLMSGSSNSRATLTSSTNTSSTDLHGLNVSKQFYLPNSSISYSPSYPTINLDLTVPSTSSSSQFKSSHSSFRSIPRYLTSSNFSALESNFKATSGDPKSDVGSLSLGKQPQEHFHLPYMPKNNPTAPQQPLSETIAAATKVITSDPTFRSVLEAAITSMVNKASAGENFGSNLKWVEKTYGLPIHPTHEHQMTMRSSTDM